MQQAPPRYDPHFGKKLGVEVRPSPGLNLTAWEQELNNDPDKEFLLNGISNGFDIIDEDSDISPVLCANHPSARTSSPLYAKASAQVLNEIECGNYVICDSAPEVVSPMAAIPKPDGGVRLIHDCSRPPGRSVNDYCSTDWKQKFARVDNAASLMTEGCWFSKVDLKHAYRSVGISEKSQLATGLQWEFKGKTIYMKDTKLPFGARLSPGIFHRITQAVKRIMARKGYDLLIVYLDDFLLISNSKEACAEALSVLISLLRKLGFSIHRGKVVDPTQKITFLGVELDSVQMSMRLPHDKLCILRQELQGFLGRKRATKRQLQSLAGRLSWAAAVVKGGRVFLRRIFNKISMLRHSCHRTLVTVDVRQDIVWWFQFIQSFNGKSLLLDKTPIECVYTDACDKGAGGSFGADWFYYNWSQDWPEAETFHINEKEVLAVVLAAYRWSHLWQHKKVIIYSDNSVTVASINKGTARNKTIMRGLRSLFWLSAIFNFHLVARFIPGISNTVADSASRVHAQGFMERLLPYTDYSPLHFHMSSKSLKFLLDRFPCWRVRIPIGPYSTPCSWNWTAISRFKA